MTKPLDEEPTTGEWQEIVSMGGEIPPTLPSVRNQDTTDLVGWHPANFRKLENPNKALKIKSRPGRGGQITYIDWTMAAEILDNALGIGQWYLDPVKISEFPRPDPDPKNPGDLMYEYTVLYRFIHPQVAPFPVFGHGWWYAKDPAGSKADALEAAYSRAVTKACARLSSFVRPLWARDTARVAQISAPAEVAVQGTRSLIDQINNLGKGDKINEILADRGWTIDSLATVPAGDLIKFQQEISKLMSG